MNWTERILNAAITAAFFPFFAWLAYQWVFNHEACCEKCRTRRELAELRAEVHGQRTS